MDSIFSSLALERLVGYFENVVQQNSKKEKFDIIIYDGMSTEETIRMIGATSKARLDLLQDLSNVLCLYAKTDVEIHIIISTCRLYLKYLRNFAEKTDLGRLASPSLLRLAEEAMTLSGRNPNLNGKMSSEIWDLLEQVLEVCQLLICFQDAILFELKVLMILHAAERVFNICRTKKVWLLYCGG